MAKKDNLGRVLIPADIVQKCSFLSEKTPSIAFGMNSNNEVFVGLEFNFQSFNCSYLGSCHYDEKTHTLFIPENVEIALGRGSEYYFAERNQMLLIYKKPATLNLDKLKSYPSKLLDGVSKWLKED